MSETFSAFIDEFVLESQERCDRLEELLLGALATTDRDPLLDDAKRELHTLKGNAGMVGFSELQAAAHALEQKVVETDPESPLFRDLFGDVDALRLLLRSRISEVHGIDDVELPRAQQIGSIRVAFTALDELVDLLAEMVVFRNRLDDALTTAARDRDDDEWQEVIKAHDALGKTLSFLQDRIMAVRMVPLRTLFGQLRRIVHDESARSSKIARFVAEGGDTPLDKALLEAASEALGHLVRNAVTHGIERPEQRLARGKSTDGIVRISAATSSDEVRIDVIDDGGGIDASELLLTAQSRGIVVDAMRDPLRVIFENGFSTRGEADMSSGRGFGLSAALEAVRRVGGDIDVESLPSRGTRFRLRLPLSVSITRAMVVRVDGEPYALPLASIAETIRLDASETHRINDAGVLRWRGRVIPLLDLGLAMGTAGELRTKGYVLVVEVDGRDRGIAVDELVGIRQIVVKGLGEIGGTPPGVAGATILGDGRVLLILDAKSLLAMSPLLHPTEPTGAVA